MAVDYNQQLRIWDTPTGDTVEYLVIHAHGGDVISSGTSFMALADLEGIRSVHLIEPTGQLPEVGIHQVSAGSIAEFEIHLEADRDAVVEQFAMDCDGVLEFDDVYVDGFTV